MLVITAVRRNVRPERMPRQARAVVLPVRREHIPEPERQAVQLVRPEHILRQAQAAVLVVLPVSIRQPEPAVVRTVRPENGLRKVRLHVH